MDPRLYRIVAAQPYPLLFATISGAHVLPLDAIVGLEVRDETVQQEMIVPPDTSSGLRPPNGSVAPSPSALGGPSPTANTFRQFPTDSSPQSGEGAGALEMDIVSHDVKKFFGLLLKKNGYVLEQLYSPLIVHTTPEHAELKEICRTRLNSRSSRGNEAHSESGKDQSLLTSAATGVITKHHSHHYFGFSETQWKLFDKERPRRVKPLLYVYRVLLTGIHLMRTGVVNANPVELNGETGLPYIAGLIARKQSGCLHTATTPRSKIPTWSFTTGNTSACALNCRRRMR